MAELKTRPTGENVEGFLNSIAHEGRRADSWELVEMMRGATGAEPRMWGPSIIGFGSYHYRYASGREGDMPIVGFSPRKQNLTLYISSDFDQFDDLRQKLGKHSVSVSCLYINKLDDVDKDILREMIRLSVTHMKSKSQ